MSALQHEAVPEMAPERFASVLSPGEYEALLGLVEQAARELHGRVIWNVTPTAKGGGKAAGRTAPAGRSSISDRPMAATSTTGRSRSARCATATY